MKSIEELAKELEQDVFWKYEKYNPEVQHKVCMVSGGGLAIEVARYVRKLIIEGKIKEISKWANDLSGSSTRITIIELLERLTELKKELSE